MALFKVQLLLSLISPLLLLLLLILFKGGVLESVEIAHFPEIYWRIIVNSRDDTDNLFSLLYWSI